MKKNDLEEPGVREAIQRARADSVKEKVDDLTYKEVRPKPTREQRRHRLELLVKQTGNAREAVRRLERILKGDDLTDIKYLMQGILCARSICRIVVHSQGEDPSYGTGFLVAPGVVMTNFHVLPDEASIQVACLEFNYALDLQGRQVAPTTFGLRTDPKPILSQELDLAIAAVEPLSEDGKPLEQFSWLKLNDKPNKAFIGEYLTIIQHPRGQPKQVCVRENKVLTYSGTGPYIWYQTDTDAGSSGSPVFNNAWEVVALHHCSVPNTNEAGQPLTCDGDVADRTTDNDEIDWLANEGVRVSKIIEYLQGLGPDPLAQCVLTAADTPTVPLPAMLGFGGEADTVPPQKVQENKGTSVQATGIQVSSDSEGVTHILVPVEITLKVNVAGVQSSAAVVVNQPASPVAQTVHSRDISTPPGAKPADGQMEKVVIDQMTYDHRNGYDPRFLGDGLVVPLPEVTGFAEKNFGRVLHFKTGTAQQDEHVLKYWNYSVVMNQDRRIAYFSAANVNSANSIGERDAAGDTWYVDTRIGQSFQLSDRDKFYGDPFDKGHLTSRSDLQWWYIDDQTLQSQEWLKLTNEEKDKRKLAIAKVYGDDSFHWTNCSPQHGAFNRASTRNGLWRRLELASIMDLSNKNVHKFCIINGPVFNAPCSAIEKVGNASRVKHLNLDGSRDPDITFRGVQIPKLFFKVIAYSVKGQDAKMQLRAKAFVVSQENLLNAENGVQEAFTEQEIQIYQVSIRALEKLTRLTFGTLSQSDWLGKQESFTQDVIAEINDLNDLAL